MKDFDVIVIGSGMGGLSAATSLAKSGKKMLVLEKHNVPGGCATSFLRGRFEFEIALHELSGLGSENNQGPLYRILSNYGVYPKVEFVKIKELFHSYFPDFEITAPIGRENFERAICEQFPKHKDSIMKMSAIIFSFAVEYVKAQRIGMEAAIGNPSQFPTLVSYYGKTVDQVMNPIILDEKIRAVFGQMWSYLCVPPSRCSFDIYAMLMSAYITFGPAHIRGKSQALSQAFVDTIEGYGGEVWLNSGVKKILSRGGKVNGVVTTNGVEILAPYIVCNANPLTVCFDLIGAENVPGWYLKRLNTWTSGASFFIVYMGLDRPYTDLGAKAHENFINLGYDLNRQYELCARSLAERPDGIALSVYNVADEQFSPPGTSSMVICMLNYTEPWIKLSGPEYLKAKNMAADRLITASEKVIPGIRDSIEVMEVATPLTTVRYTGSPGGSVVGFDENFQVTGRKRLPSRGPLEGLYFASAWVNLGGGFEVCMETGHYTAREVLHDITAGGKDAALMEKIETQIKNESSAALETGKHTLAAERKAIRSHHADHLSLKVRDIIKETTSACTFRLEPVEGHLPYFRAGQYLSLVVDINGVVTNRPYSISSPPGKPYYDITVRRAQGGFVSHFLLDEVKKGNILKASGPHGSFYHEPVFDAKNLVLLAGGSGITPFMSMIREEVKNMTGLNMHLIYGSRTPDDIIFASELDKIAGHNANIKVDFVISEPPGGWQGKCGFLDAKTIQDLVGPVKNKTFMICGPGQMYDLCDGALRILGLPLRRIRWEAYGPPADISLEPGWTSVDPASVFTVKEEKTGKTFQARASEPLLISLEKAGLVVPAVCRSGECTACRTKLLNGKVFSPERVKKRWIDEKANYMHPCMSYPLGDLIIRI
ncbi:MAG: FAD-dependent oxidoreductase [Dehalococcoidia bacterium]|jgi:prolycopene isomerase